MTVYDGLVAPENWLCQVCDRPRHRHPCIGFVRRGVGFAAMLRVKNEERWIREVIESIKPLCEIIFVMDDHSTDKTVDICSSLQWSVRGNVHVEHVRVLRSPFTGLNESRDKNWLYDRIMEYCEPQWILCIDGDEVLEKNGPQIISDWCATTKADSAKLKIAFMWNDPHTVRVDRIYDDFWRPSLFRPFIPDPDKPDDLKLLVEFRFKATPFGRHVNGNQPNLHCSSVPQRRFHEAAMCPVRLKHYGYMDRADRVRKLDYYTSIDWNNEAEDCYRHMCQGDAVDPLRELPKTRTLIERGDVLTAQVLRLRAEADEYLLHAGPLQLRPWDESALWQMSDWARSQQP